MGSGGVDAVGVVVGTGVVILLPTVPSGWGGTAGHLPQSPGASQFSLARAV